MGAVGARRLFDAYMAVDWSARDTPSPRQPSRDAIWLAHQAARLELTATAYVRTRQECFEQLRGLLVEHVANGQRVFVGFDFPFGYPSGFAAALGLQASTGGPAWRLIWSELSWFISDQPGNSNNRFDAAALLNRRCGGERPGPLWGCPGGIPRPGLPARSPGYPYAAGRGPRLERLRWTEKRQQGTQPAWKLFGAGSVGSQCLVGIPYVHRLREDPELQAVSRIWPFETGFAMPAAIPGEPVIVHAEIWPRLAPGRNAAAPIRDEDQVRAMVSWLRSLDDRGWMEELLRTPPNLPPGALRQVLVEKGWIAGTR